MRPFTPPKKPLLGTTPPCPSSAVTVKKYMGSFLVLSYDLVSRDRYNEMVFKNINVIKQENWRKVLKMKRRKIIDYRLPEKTESMINPSNNIFLPDESN